MKEYILIRGPISVGKSQVASLTTAKLREKAYNAFLLCTDRFRKHHNLTEPTYYNKKKSVELLIPQITYLIDCNYIPVVEGVFYENDLRHTLVNSIQNQALRIKLVADLETCLSRDKLRKKSRGSKKVLDVWNLSKNQDQDEILVDTQNKSLEEVAQEICLRFTSF